MTDPATLLVRSARRAIPIHCTDAADWPRRSRSLKAHERKWLDATGFTGKPGQHAVLQGHDGLPEKVFWADSRDADPYAFGRLARLLPAGTYRIEDELAHLTASVLGWLLEAYQFDRYRAKPIPSAFLVCPKGVDRDDVLRRAEAHYLVRDLVNTPASDMGPDELEAAARKVATAHRAKVNVITGRALERDFPMIHTVGMASPRAPRLIDLRWGAELARKVTLVGKGVCFDTGGLDVKPASNMLLMKKDMGGAANVLGLAQMIMAARLDVRLRVLIAAVENSIAGNAFRPGDVLKSRKGVTVEIGNTDAEGRLVLADALALADEEEPDLLVDMATLTGAARVALGPDLPPFYTTDDDLAAELARNATARNDPLWRMPLWTPYYSLIDSMIGDINNAGDSGFAGSVTAALFLKRFVDRAKSYVHFDIFAWTPISKAGRPKGGEAQGIHALFDTIRTRYAK
ncbi:leucyl aminopeptidase family protein [soil metagenome]